MTNTHSDTQLVNNIRTSDRLNSHIRTLATSQASSPSSTVGSRSQSFSDDAAEGGASEIAALARRIIEITDGDQEADVSVSLPQSTPPVPAVAPAPVEAAGEEDLRKSVRDALSPRPTQAE
jgi:vacuolar protein 8